MNKKVVHYGGRVNGFLNSISRKNKNTANSYSSSLVLLDSFTKLQYPEFNYNTIVDAVNENKINVYELLDKFVSHLLSIKAGISAKSMAVYLAALRSYFSYHDIDVIPARFRRKVFMPKIYREDEQPLDATDIRKLLLNCNNRRLKVYLLVLASGGMRAVEALAIRNRDIDFTFNPAKVHIRAEYSKTKVGRDVYISEEATKYLKQWLDWKYKNPDRRRKFDKDDLVFAVYRTASKPQILYQKIWYEFLRLLKTVKMDEKKKNGIKKRRIFTFHSLRRFVKTVISEQAGQDYSEWFLGHSKSPYWTMKESKKREIYSTKIMKYLTFLDYSTLEASGRSIEMKLLEKEREIQSLKERDLDNADAISVLSDKLNELMKEVQLLKRTDNAL